MTFLSSQGADLVLVGMGMGRQEHFLLELRNQGWEGAGICVGGFIDKLADPALRYPKWTERDGLRFFLKRRG